MRRVRNADGTHRIWLNQYEYENVFRPAATGYDHVLAVRLGAEVGLRANEIAKVKPKHIIPVQTVTDDPNKPEVLEGTMLDVPHGKDTTGKRDGGKAREAWLPSSVRQALIRFSNERNRDDDEYLFSQDGTMPYRTKTIRNYIKHVARAAAEESSDHRFEDISSHDMRRYYATTMLQKHGLNPEVLMRVGGWEDYESLKPYLEAPTDDVVIEEFHRIGKG